MLEIKFVSQNLSTVKEVLDARGYQVDLETFKKCDEDRRVILQEIESLRHRRNVVSDQIAALKKAGENADDRVLEMREVSSRIKELDQQLAEVKERAQSLFGASAREALRDPSIADAIIQRFLLMSQARNSPSGGTSPRGRRTHTPAVGLAWRRSDTGPVRLQLRLGRIRRPRETPGGSARSADPWSAGRRPAALRVVRQGPSDRASASTGPRRDSRACIPRHGVERPATARCLVNWKRR